jgi:hypothetical protein
MHAGRVPAHQLHPHLCLRSQWSHPAVSAWLVGVHLLFPSRVAACAARLQGLRFTPLPRITMLMMFLPCSYGHAGAPNGEGHVRWLRGPHHASPTGSHEPLTRGSTGLTTGRVAPQIWACLALSYGTLNMFAGTCLPPAHYRTATNGW